MLFVTSTDWWHLGRALGFAPHQAGSFFRGDTSFQHLRRALGPRLGDAPQWGVWHYGIRNDRESVLLVYHTGSGKNRQTWTAIVTRLDPPLFIGASIRQEGLLSELFGGQDLRIGAPTFDAELRLSAYDPHKLKALLEPRASGDVQHLQALVRYTRDGMQVTDTTVSYILSGILTDPARAAQCLDASAWVASELERRRALMLASVGELVQRGEWQAYADERRLTFDQRRMILAGEIEATKIEIALETSGHGVFTGVTVRWPRSLGGNVTLRKGPSNFLTSLFMQDVKTGDEVFDNMFIVQGHPEPWVRQVFASPELRHTLVSLGPRAKELTMNHEACFWLWPGTAPTRADLDAHVAMALRAARALFGAAEHVSPYR